MRYEASVNTSPFLIMCKPHDEYPFCRDQILVLFQYFIVHIMGLSFLPEIDIQRLSGLQSQHFLLASDIHVVY